MIGALGFTAPWVLLGLVALPALWWLLRAVPPAPIRRRFPAVSLLLGLEHEQVEARKTPLWLVVLRMLAAVALIVGLSGPVLNPDRAQDRSIPLIVLLDSHWPAAPDWPRRVQKVDQLLSQAEQSGQPVAVALSHDSTPAALAPAAIWRERLAAMAPVAWDAAYNLSVLNALPNGRTVWISDGIAREGRGEALALREAAGVVDVLQSERSVLGLTPARLSDGAVYVRALRTISGASETAKLQSIGRDPAGQMRVLHETDVPFVAGNRTAEVSLSLPPELRHRVQRFELTGQGVLGALSAGQVTLVGEALTRRRVALVGAQATETLALLSPDHFLRAALEPSAEIIETPRLADVLRASPHVIILADVPDLSEPDQRALAKWVAEGGLLLRFAGPRLAAAQAGQQAGGAEDVLLPVRLRGRGRTVGGAMSWGAPQRLAAFPSDSPFFGLDIPEDVSIGRQVLAEPGPELASKTLARLVDGTPLVTRKLLGAGQIVLIHVGATADWSNLVLSGLFVNMLERLKATSSTRTLAGTEGDEGVGTVSWALEARLTAFGQIERDDPQPIVTGDELQQALFEAPGQNVPPGVYSHADRQLVVNALSGVSTLLPAKWPAHVVLQWGEKRGVRDLSAMALTFVTLLIIVDLFATLWVSGRWPGRSGRLVPSQKGKAALVFVTLCFLTPDLAGAQQGDGRVLDQISAAAAEVTLAHVLTGDDDLDALARAGLTGLSNALYARSSVEPASPVGVVLDHDELSVFPLLYWPVSLSQPMPSAAAYERLTQYLAGGGLILLDTRDAGAGGGEAMSRKLQALAVPLSLPALEPIPVDHVLTRAFYLIDSFPGRYSGPVWAEAAPPGAIRTEGLPFRLLNDGVTPVIIGGNDWAGAWAVRDNGAPLLPVGRGYAGERQREMSLRFGVNLVMHVLTGNYKSDQVHVPALLQRLGQ